ncbi:hypothetical protein A167_00080 [Alcanivorax sp. S71-1-4]|uniref:pilus assembly protein TadG-related protein n=1 Tax=Alcanivorax sp. S71-1-4 TaxID=1177159 RepID=UPI0013570408|nr:hypothetical protein [Alcanivorax sp. S71-1-4]KAF0811048.1 hypothetical protein A167_00080 [Alcanivorax sp. S71-1-4]
MNRRERIALLSSQRGALAVTTPLLIVLIIVLTVLLLDGARLYATKREMQSIANAAAMAAADAAQACGGEIVNQSMIEAAAVAAANEQGMSRLGGSLSVVQPGTLVAGDNAVMGFRPIQNSIDESNAVRVVYALTSPISLLVPDQVGSVDMETTAVARREVIATVSASGSTAIIGGDDETAGLLGALLGSILTGGDPFALDATDIRSLANTTFVLGEFLEDLGVSGLLNAVDQTVPADMLLRGILAGLDDGAGMAGGAIDELLAASGLINTNVRLGDVINLVGNIPYPEETRVPVYDTIVALALNTLAGQVFELPIDVDLNVAGLLGAELRLTVGQAPSVVIGPARFQPDGEAMVTFEAADVVLNLVVSADVLGLATLTLPLMVETGGGTGYLQYADCAAGLSNDVLLGFVLEPSVARISTSTLSPAGAVVPSAINATLLDIPGLNSLLPVFEVNGTIAGLNVGTPQTMTRSVVYNMSDKEPGVIATGSDLTLSTVGSALDLQVSVKRKECGPLGLNCLLGAILGPILDLVGGLANVTVSLVQNTVLAILSDVLTNVLGPLLQALGVNLGGMIVEVTDATQTGVALIDCSIMPCDVIIEEE